MSEKRQRTLEQKETRLREFIKKQGSLLISFSGGLDSALLAIISREVLGQNSRCAFLRSSLMARIEEHYAKDLSEKYQLSCMVLPFPILRSRSFRVNPADRCYHCKKSAAILLKATALKWGLKHIADGLNLSDYEEYRPGIRASDEEGILHPYIEAGMTKQDIRTLARIKELELWNKASSACLASRIPYGEEITTLRLHIVESAEKIVRSFGVQNVRLRLHGNIARLEVSPQDMPVVLAHRERLVESLKGQEICYVTLDLEGYRSGSLDETLPNNLNRKRQDQL